VATAIAVAIEQIFERQDRLVWDRFDEPGAEQRHRRPPREDVRVVWR
jgi:hypothetical protein